jgi:hypothetical protein
MHPDSISNDCCKPCRENVSSILRRKARSMHEAAVRLEVLADVAERLSGNEEAALYDLATSSR